MSARTPWLLALALSACAVEPVDPADEAPMPGEPVIACQTETPACDPELGQVFEGSVRLKIPADVEALAGVTCIWGHLRIDPTVSVDEVRGPEIHSEDLEALAALEVVCGDLEVNNAPEIRDLEGLRSLRHVGRRVMLSALYGLETLDGLRSLEADALEGLTLDDLGLVVDLHGLEQVRVADSVLIRANASLTTLAGLGLERAETLDIAYNHSPADIDALDALSYVGELDVRGQGVNDDAPLTISGFAGLSSAGSITMWGNSTLESITGFANLTTLEGELVIAQSDRLDDLSGFAALTEVGGLDLRESAAPSLADFASLTAVHDRLYILRNAALAQADAEAFAADFLAPKVKVDGNGPDFMPYAPCPYEGDGECDSAGGTELCSFDDDCCILDGCG